jgi:hypothetical protein
MRKGPQDRAMLEQVCPLDQAPPQACNRITPPMAAGVAVACKVLRLGAAEPTPQCNRALAAVVAAVADDASTHPLVSLVLAACSYLVVEDTECRQSI